MNQVNLLDHMGNPFASIEVPDVLPDTIDYQGKVFRRTDGDLRWIEYGSSNNPPPSPFGWNSRTYIAPPTSA